MKIPSRPYLQLELPLIMPKDKIPNEQMPNDKMSNEEMTNQENGDVNDRLDANRHLQEDLMDATLPNNWRLHEAGNDRWYARHPEAGQTPDMESPEQAAEEAQALHQDWIENRASHEDADSTDSTPSESVDAAGEAAPDDPQSTGVMIGDSNGEDVKSLVRQRQAEKGIVREVYHAEKGEYVEITQEMLGRAEHAVKQMRRSKFVECFWLAYIWENDLWAALGYNTKSDFVDSETDYSMRQVRRYSNAGRPYLDLFPNGLDPEEAPAQITGDVAPEEEGDAASPPEENADPDAFERLNLGQLIELGDLDEERLQELAQKKKLTTEDGEVFTMDDIERMTRQKARELVEEVTQEHEQARENLKSEAEEQKERALRAEEEREALKERLKEKEDEIEEAKGYREQFGEAAARLKEKRQFLQRTTEKVEEAEEAIDEAIERAGKIGLSPEDPEGDLGDLLRLYQRLNAMQEERLERLMDVLRTDYGEALIAAQRM